MAKTACYCGSDKPFTECCGPIIHGTSQARTPEEVMRARFSAHCIHNYEYLVTSCHPEHREDVNVEEIQNWAQHITWTDLEVLSATPGETPDKGHVSFIANYTVRDIPQELKEDAVFQKHNGTWYYVDGVVQGEEPFVREFPRIGRNDLCPCNSGKKFKKCCGK